MRVNALVKLLKFIPSKPEKEANALIRACMTMHANCVALFKPGPECEDWFQENNLFSAKHNKKQNTSAPARKSALTTVGSCFLFGSHNIVCALPHQGSSFFPCKTPFAGKQFAERAVNMYCTLKAQRAINLCLTPTTPKHTTCLVPILSTPLQD